MKQITVSLLLFSLIIAPVSAGESDATNRHELKNSYKSTIQSFFVQHKKPIIACAAFAATAGAVFMYARNAGSYKMLGDMNYTDEASRVVGSGDDATIADYAVHAWNSSFAYTLRRISGAPQISDYFQKTILAKLKLLQKPHFRIELQHTISSCLKQAYNSSALALCKFRSELHDVHQDMAPYSELDDAYQDMASYTAAQNTAIKNVLRRVEVSRQAQESCSDDISEKDGSHTK
jgi:hypothetical protein